MFEPEIIVKIEDFIRARIW